MSVEIVNMGPQRKRDARIAVDLFPEEWGWFTHNDGTFKGRAFIERRSNLVLEHFTEVTGRHEEHDPLAVGRDVPWFGTDAVAMLALINKLRDTNVHFEIVPIPEIPDGQIGCHISKHFSVAVHYHFRVCNVSLPSAVAEAVDTYLDWKKGRAK